MVCKLICECDERVATDIDSFNEFEEIRDFFQNQVDKKIYNDLSDYKKIWYQHGGNERSVYRLTTKVYKCNICGCLWEFNYPEFPMLGSVRKFADGVYHPN